MRIETRKIVYAGLFIAISIILTRLLAFYPIPTIRISFGDLPIMLSGIILGPFLGAVTGALSDIIGTFMFPPPTGAAYFPGFTLSKILVGSIPVLIYNNINISGLFKVAISVIITEIVCSLTLDTLWLSMMYNKGMLILLPTRIISRSIIMTIEVILLHVILARLIKKDSFGNA